MKLIEEMIVRLIEAGRSVEEVVALAQKADEALEQFKKRKPQWVPVKVDADGQMTFEFTGNPAPTGGNVTLTNGNITLTPENITPPATVENCELTVAAPEKKTRKKKEPEPEPALEKKTRKKKEPEPEPAPVTNPVVEQKATEPVKPSEVLYAYSAFVCDQCGQDKLTFRFTPADVDVPTEVNCTSCGAKLTESYPPDLQREIIAKGTALAIQAVAASASDEEEYFDPAQKKICKRAAQKTQVAPEKADFTPRKPEIAPEKADSAPKKPEITPEKPVLMPKPQEKPVEQPQNTSDPRGSAVKAAFNAPPPAVDMSKAKQEMLAIMNSWPQDRLIKEYEVITGKQFGGDAEKARAELADVMLAAINGKF